MPKSFKETIEPYVVGTAEAQRLGGWGKTKLFELIAAGELDSYLDGRVRRITLASIHARNTGSYRKLRRPHKRRPGRECPGRFYFRAGPVTAACPYKRSRFRFNPVPPATYPG